MLAINTSPEKERGAVSLLLDPFLDGLRESGAEAELYYARDMVTSKSRDSDVLQWLRQKIGQADVLVLASPLYFDGRTGPEGATPSLRALLERLIPGTQMPADRPYRQEAHTVREDACPGRVVIASGSGFWEIGGLCQVSACAEALCNNTTPELAYNADARVLLRGALPRGMLDWDIISAAREAGCQLASEEAVPQTSHDIVRREAVTRDFYIRITSGSPPTGKVVSYAMPAMLRCTQKED